MSIVLMTSSLRRRGDNNVTMLWCPLYSSRPRNAIPKSHTTRTTVREFFNSDTEQCLLPIFDGATGTSIQRVDVGFPSWPSLENRLD